MHNLRMWEFVPVLSPSDHAFLIIDQCRPVPILDRGGGGGGNWREGRKGGGRGKPFSVKVLFEGCQLLVSGEKVPANPSD